MSTVRAGSTPTMIIGYAVMILVLLVIGLPLFWVVVTSLKPDNLH